MSLKTQVQTAGSFPLAQRSRAVKHDMCGERAGMIGTDTCGTAAKLRCEMYQTLPRKW